MKILAIDTSTQTLGVALLEDGQLIVESISNLKINHSIRLMPLIEQVFATAGWRPEEIGLVAVAKGPGSYTGLRVGVTTAKTYAWALNAPLVAVSTLAVMAYPLRHYGGAIAPIIDARRGEVYTGLFSGKTEDSTSRAADARQYQELAPERIMLLTEWLAEIREIVGRAELAERRVIFVGGDIVKHASELAKWSDFVDLAAADYALPRPGVLGLLGYQQYLAGDLANVHTLTPTYLQLAYAEKLKKR
jgi:tRNA threonylcarbamoyladenosine biosynthesis protein TsaB